MQGERIKVPGEDLDQKLKALFTRAHDGFLALFLPDAIWEAELSPELPAIKRLADLLWIILISGQRIILHIEMQTRPDPVIGERMAEYAMRIYRHHHLPVWSIVIYIRPSEAIIEGPFVMGWTDNPRLVYHFDTIRLWQEPAERILSQPFPEIWPLAGLMGGTTIEQMVEVSERIAHTPIQRQESE